MRIIRKVVDRVVYTKRAGGILVAVHANSAFLLALVARTLRPPARARLHLAGGRLT
jgi:hypothetical protein